MLKHLGGWTKLSSPPLFPLSSNCNTPLCTTLNLRSTIEALKPKAQPVLRIRCRARRRVRYEEEEEGEEDEYEHNAEIAALELYSQIARGEALLVQAMVDDQDVEVLIFKVSFFLDLDLIILSCVRIEFLPEMFYGAILGTTDFICAYSILRCDIFLGFV